MAAIGRAQNQFFSSLMCEKIGWKNTALALSAYVLTFIFIAYKALCWSYTQLKAWYCQWQEIIALVIKRSPYVYMPLDEIGFLRKAFDNFRAELPKENREEFDQQFKDQDPEIFSRLALAAARAAVFSIGQISFYKYQILVDAHTRFQRAPIRLQKQMIDLCDSREIPEELDLYRPVLTVGSQLIQNPNFITAISRIMAL